MPTCPVCHGHYALTELTCPRRSATEADTVKTLAGRVCLCPRCQTDIYSWRSESEDQAGEGAISGQIGAVLRRVYPLLMAFLALLLGIAGQHPHWVGSLLAVVLSAVAFLVLRNKASEFRIASWARPFKAEPGLSLVALELGSFVVGLAVGLVALVLIKYWILPPALPTFMEKLITSLAYSLFFVLITVALTALMVNNQIRKLDRFMPQPVFTNTRRMLDIVIRSAKEQMGLDAELNIEGVRRTGDAGIQVVVSLARRAMTTEKTSETMVLRQRQGGASQTSRVEEEKVTQKDGKGNVARWVIRADMWARIRSIDVRDWWTFVDA